MFLPGVRIDDIGFHHGHVAGQSADDLERQKRMAQMIQDAQEEHHIELAQARRREFIEIEHTIIDLGLQPAVDLQERRDLDAIDRHDLGPVALGLEAEPSVPRADVEHALAAQIVWEWDSGRSALFAPRAACIRR